MSDPDNELESLHEPPQQPCEPPADEVVAESEGDPVTADDADPEKPGPAPQPENWNVLAQQTYEQLEKEMQSLHRVWDRHSYAAWLAVMQIIPRVRAFKEHIGGDAFQERCRKLCRIGKTAAGNIVRWVSLSRACWRRFGSAFTPRPTPPLCAAKDTNIQA
jgi:hypothetical protein